MAISLKLAKTGSKDATTETLVLFATSASGASNKSKKNAKTSNKQAPKSITKLNDPSATKSIQSYLDDGLVAGKNKEVQFFRGMGPEGSKNLMTLGLGDSPDHESIRQAAATAYKALVANKQKSATFLLDGLANKDLVRGMTEGLILASYKFDELKSKTKDEPMNIVIATAKAADVAVKKSFEDAVIVGETVNFSRRLGDLPGNLMTPTLLANAVVGAAKGTKLKVTVWDKKRIEKENMGGIMGVAQGSSEEPRFIIMEYKGGAAGKKPLVFVGKGLTFDCGGISIKPSAGMEEMKYDMCGGANVIGALLTIAKLGLKVNAIGLVPSTENLVGPSATKPGDVHYARNGKSFEVNNTDAEGRLILADALCYASEQDPELIVDAATLTGAMVMALGNTHTGYFTRNAALKDRVEKAAQSSGEWVWHMPLTDFHYEDIKGTYADLSNISSSKGAGSATAAAFLQQFVGEDIPWAHFDIAGTAWHCGNRLPYYNAKGATGAIVRTFVELAKQFSAR